MYRFRLFFIKTSNVLRGEPSGSARIRRGDCAFVRARRLASAPLDVRCGTLSRRPTRAQRAPAVPTPHGGGRRAAAARVVAPCSRGPRARPADAAAAVPGAGCTGRRATPRPGADDKKRIDNRKLCAVETGRYKAPPAYYYYLCKLCHQLVAVRAHLLFRLGRGTLSPVVRA